jgi:hypothetical protein
MGFNFAHLTRWLLLAGVALAVAYPAQAQRANRRPGQSILFSSADDDNVSSNRPSVAPKPPGSLDFANAIQSPDANLGTASQAGSLPVPPPPAISPAQAQDMQRLLKERKNWALLTPEQIFGLPTPEKILDLPERNAAGRPKNESIVAQYYERQDQSRNRSNNINGVNGAADSSPHWGFTGDQQPQMNPGVWTPAGGGLNHSALMDQFLNGTPDSRAAAQTPKGGWLKSFNLPAPTPGPAPEQQAAMNQFQQLLQLHSLPGDTAKSPSLGSPIFSPASTTPVPAPSAVTPVGESYTPLSSGIATPIGVTPLPGLLGPTNAASPAFAPEWKPPPPPWMSSGPQLGVIPQRKF